VALEIEPHVARIRLRQEREPAVRLRREQVDAMLAGAPAMNLELGLVAQLGERLGTDLRDARVGRSGAERLHRLDAAGDEPVVLQPRHAGDERQMVVALPLLLAARQELAQRAVLDRIRVGRRAAVLHDGEEALAHAPVVGGEVLGPEALALPGAGNDVHRPRRATRDPRHLLAVEGELEHVSRPSVPSQLRIDDLVGPVRLPLDEVGLPEPPPVGQDRLVDDVGTAKKRSLGRSRIGRLDNVAALGAQPREVGGLPLLTLATN
jgi:hypothetical protein